MKTLIALAAMSFIACGAAYAADAPAPAATTTPAKTTAAPADKSATTAKTTTAPADKSAAAAGEKTLTPQQEKMKTCNTKATGMKGDERDKFMKTCLSSKPAAPENKMAMCNSKTKGLKKEEADKVRSECMKA